MGFAEGFARGLQIVQQAYEAKDEQARRQQQLEWQREDRGIQREERRTQADIALQQLDLQRQQVAEAKRRAEIEARLQEAEQRIRTAGEVKVDMSVVPGAKEGEQETVYTVEGKQFKGRAEADAEAARLNTPVLIAKRQYAAASAAGVPQLTERFGNLYNIARTTAEAEFKQSFQDAFRTGGVDGIVSLYNSQVKDGRTLVPQRMPDGKLMVSTYVGGKRQGEPEVYGSENEFIKHQLLRYQADPATFIESFHRDRTFAEGVRQFNVSSGLQRDSLRETARAHDMQHRVGMAQVANSAAGVGVQREALAVQRAGQERPVVFPTQTVDKEGNTIIGATVVRPDGMNPTATHLRAGVQPGQRTPPKDDPYAAIRGRTGGAGGKPGWSVPDDALQRFGELPGVR